VGIEADQLDQPCASKAQEADTKASKEGASERLATKHHWILYNIPTKNLLIEKNQLQKNLNKELYQSHPDKNPTWTTTRGTLKM